MTTAPLPQGPPSTKTLNQLKETVFETAVAFQAANEEPETGKWALSARWGDYTKALQAHADYFLTEYQQAQAEGTE